MNNRNKQPDEKKTQHKITLQSFWNMSWNFSEHTQNYFEIVRS